MPARHPACHGVFAVEINLWQSAREAAVELGCCRIFGGYAVMIAFWTILHGIMAIGLVGAVTHQGLTVWRRAAPAQLFIDRFRAIPAVRFANSITVLYVLTFALGGYIYPTYVLDVKGAVADYGMHATIGIFQLKEHLAVIALGMLPVYLHFWRRVPLTDSIATRRFLTTFMMLTVWWNLVVGHVLNNIRGLT
jgi:hypothetical protein